MTSGDDKECDNKIWSCKKHLPESALIMMMRG